MDTRDPGWLPALSGIWRGLLPILGSVGRTSKPAIIYLRSLWLSLLVTWALFAALLRFIQGEPSVRKDILPALVAGVGGIDLALLLLLRAHAIKIPDRSSIADVYARVSLVGFSITSASVLWGFVAFFMDGGMPAYLVGIPFGLAGFAIMGPTRANIEHFQRKLRDAGIGASLMQALMSPLPPLQQRPTRPRKPGPSPPSPPS